MVCEGRVGRGVDCGVVFYGFWGWVWLGFVDGLPKRSVEYFEVDFGACEWCGTTTACGRGRCSRCNVNIPAERV